MRALLGYDASARKHKNIDEPIYWDSTRLVNPHLAVLGTTGAGKSTMIRAVVDGVVRTSQHHVDIHVLDVHGDLAMPGCSTVLFSTQTPFGLNPLAVSADPDFGGLINPIQNFIEIVNAVSATKLGVKQESCLRNLLNDVYTIHGFDKDDPATWHVNESDSQLINGGERNRLYLTVPRKDYESAQALGAKWDVQLGLFYIHRDQYVGAITEWLPKTVGRKNPNVNDVLIYAKRVLMQSFLGADQEAVLRLEVFCKAAKAYNRKALDVLRRQQRNWNDEELQNAASMAGEKAVVTYANFVESVRTGNEIENLMKYESADVLSSVVDRLQALMNTGLFKSDPIRFAQGAKICHYKLNPLRTPAQLMFVLFRLQEIWADAKEQGESDVIRHVIILDEFGKYETIVKNPDNIINVLARESRKYGIMLLLAGQDPDQIPPKLMSSIGTKVILENDDIYRDKLVKKMMVPDALVAWIRAHRSFGIHMKERVGAKNKWLWAHPAKPGAMQ